MLKTIALALTLVSASASFAQSTDLPNSADHPVLKRFTGSVITGYAVEDWGQAKLPVSAKLSADKRRFDTLQTLEGKITRINYFGPKGKSALEVFRNYQQALAAAGLQVRVLCQQACEDLYSTWAHRDDSIKPLKNMQWAKGSLPGTGIGYDDALWDRDGAMIIGSLRNPATGASMQMLLYVSAAPARDGNQYASTFVQFIEPKAMQAGQVNVDATAIGQGLKAEGKVTLAGLFFDTGKSELKPESKPQLDEMAKLLQAQPAAKVFIVGHTDNVGAFDANAALSLARAQAVVAALGAAPYKVDPKRLSAKGAANIAPVASNADEAGRARNRRVELVLQ
jgi:OOP family OmpA-OmpF porin